MENNYMETIKDITEATTEFVDDAVTGMPVEDLVTAPVQDLAPAVPVDVIVETTTEAVAKQPSVLMSIVKTGGKLAGFGLAVYGGVKLAQKGVSLAKNAYETMKAKKPGGPEHNFATEQDLEAAPAQVPDEKKSK